LSAADILYKKFNEADSELDLELICFHLQQCAEKLMKAALSKNQINFPKIHDLEALLTIITNNKIDLHPDPDLLIELNDYAVEGRYAIMQDDIENLQNIFSLLSEMVKETNKIIHSQ
jgi:HEPN domain-containing protein